MLKNKKRFIHISINIFVICILITLLILDVTIFITDFIRQNEYEKSVKEDSSIKTENSFNVTEMKKEEKNNQIKIQTEEKINIKENIIGNIEVADEEINIYLSNPWRIKIPKLRLNAPIAEGTSQEALRRTVGHFEQTDRWNGNVALAAHNRGYRCNFFGEIKNLQKGDKIIYCTEYGERTYEVNINQVIKETDWSYIQNTKDNRITLITCETDKKEYRRCIQAIEII